jgi:hypothetical protein
LEEFVQHLWLFGVLRHAIHLGLKLARTDWRAPLIRDKLRFA